MARPYYSSAHWTLVITKDEAHPEVVDEMQSNPLFLEEVSDLENEDGVFLGGEGDA